MEEIQEKPKRGYRRKPQSAEPDAEKPKVPQCCAGCEELKAKVSRLTQFVFGEDN